MKIGKAIERLEGGYRVSSEDGSWVYLVPGVTVRPIDMTSEFALGAMVTKVIETDRPELIVQHPRLDKRERDGSITVGWTPSTRELFTDTWKVLE